MNRPRGDVRQALAVAAAELQAEQGGGTWRELALRARVGLAVGQRTVSNMRRFGELVAVASRPVGSRRMDVLAPRPVQSSPDAAAHAGLGTVLGSWHSRCSAAEASDDAAT